MSQLAPFRLPEAPARTDLVAKYFRALGDPTRLRILALLGAEGELSAGELTRRLGLAQPKVSNHLACLRWCGFVEARREHRLVHYRLADHRVADILELADGLLERNADHVAACCRIPAPLTESHPKIPRRREPDMPAVAKQSPARRPLIEVLYVEGCPNYRGALGLVEQVRAELGIDAELRTTLIRDQVAADQARFPGSPTVRVDDRDVEPGSEPPAEFTLACRLYRLEHRFAGQPDERWLREALLRTAGRT